MISAFWKREFRLELFGIEHNRPSQFVRCQWQKQPEVSRSYLVYRWLLAGYFLGTLISCIIEPGTNPGHIQKWPIYLTNWGYLMYTLQAFCAAFIVTKQFYAEKKKEYDLPSDNIKPEEMTMPRIYQFYWVVHSLAVVLAVGITISYWAAVYDPKLHTLSPFNLMAHALNTVFMIIDFFLVSHPFRLLHFYWPIAFVAIYLVFSYIYYSLGGLDRHLRPFIYPLLKWENGWKTVVICIVGLVFVFVVHVIVWLLYLLRRCIHNKCVKKEELDLSKSGFDNSVTCSDSSIHLDVI